MTPFARALLVTACVLSAAGLAAALVALGGHSGTNGTNRSIADGGAQSSLSSARSAVGAVSDASATRSVATVSATATMNRTATATAMTRATTSSSASPRENTTSNARRVISVSDKAELHLLKAYGNTLVEEGQATGNLPGRVKVNIDINPGRGTARASFTLYRANGTLSGHSSGRSQTAHGGWESFSGKMRLEQGTGQYRRASGSGTMSGAIYRRSDRLLVEQSGRLSY
jgi:hypothetical protein